MFSCIKRLRSTVGITILASTVVFSIPAHSAVVAADGGITLWVSYDNLDATDASLSDTITEANSRIGGASCTATNQGRSAVGDPNSPASCSGAMGSCTAEEKVSADIEKLATYIAQSTEGAHYLRRVYLSDEGRAWENADIKWNTGNGGSRAPFGWGVPGANLQLNSAFRTCIHDVLHHEFGHYLYNLPDRYTETDGYYRGTMPGSSTSFQVDVTGRDINTVMSNNYPHLFVDTTNASITVDYDPPGPALIAGEVLTPSLLTDGDTSNDGPNRAHHGHTHPFAQDEWSRLPDVHVDLAGVHTEGNFASPGAVPAVDIVIIGDDEPHPGTALVLDRSGSMGVTTNGITAAQYVQEAGMFLYHSAEPGDLVGTYLYNGSVEELFEYDVYDPANDLPLAAFRTATGSTDIAGALESAIDALIGEHTEGGVNGAEIYLMSDGRQTTGSSLWDEVDRATDLGIKINTFSFGNADTTTMNDIAGGSGGEPIAMSERNDAAELKMLMARKFSTGRGLTPIHTYKGRIKDRINFGANQAHVGQFNVPPKSRALQFYTFLHTGDASQDLNLQLIAPSGTTYDSPTPNHVAKKARLNGVKVDKSEPGLWTYVISSQPGSSLPNEPIEIAAYADNRELKGRSWVENIAANGQALLRAELNFRYPLTDMKVATTFYLSGDPIATLPMFDNGTNGDDFANDGIYAMTLDLNGNGWQKQLSERKSEIDKLRAETEFHVTKKSGPAKRAHYETGFSAEMAAKDYGVGNTSQFKAWATTVVNLAETKKDRPDRNPRFDQDPQDDPRDDTIKNFRGDIGKLSFTLVNARPTVDKIRLSLGQGVSAEIVDVEDLDPRSQKTNRFNNFNLQHKLDLRLDGEQREQRVRYTVKYQVEPKANTGPRDLRIQFGTTVIQKPNAIVVSD